MFSTITLVLRTVNCLLIVISIHLFFLSDVSAAEGCSDGNYIWPNPDGTTFQDCGNCVVIPRYFRTGGIFIQTDNQPGLCGIQFGTYNSQTHGRCQIRNANGVGYTEGAGLVYYDTATNTCPIDDYIPFLIIVVSLSYFLVIKKNYSLK